MPAAACTRAGRMVECNHGRHARTDARRGDGADGHGGPPGAAVQGDGHGADAAGPDARSDGRAARMVADPAGHAAVCRSGARTARSCAVRAGGDTARGRRDGRGRGGRGPDGLRVGPRQVQARPRDPCIVAPPPGAAQQLACAVGFPAAPVDVDTGRHGGAGAAAGGSGPGADGAGVPGQRPTAGRHDRGLAWDADLVGGGIKAAFEAACAGAGGAG